MLNEINVHEYEFSDLIGEYLCASGQIKSKHIKTSLCFPAGFSTSPWRRRAVTRSVFSVLRDVWTTTQSVRSAKRSCLRYVVGVSPTKIRHARPIRPHSASPQLNPVGMHSWNFITAAGSSCSSTSNLFTSLWKSTGSSLCKVTWSQGLLWI